MNAQSHPGGAETERGVRTRRLIVQTAVELFTVRGYDRTTMRAIADAAGLAVGNAYYYFPSKDHLVHELYRRIEDEHRRAAAHVLATETRFADRLRGTVHAGLDVMAPYHDFAGSFLRTAVQPGSPLSPFSDDSAPTRQASLGLFDRVVRGSTNRMDADLRAELPELLWLGHLGITLYWVHDTSPDAARTRGLVDGAVDLVDRLVRLSRLPMLRQTVHDALLLFEASSRPPLSDPDDRQPADGER